MSDASETNVIETLQSLTIAFALAMTVRSTVTEGFVIPTGSMAPTLLGAHVRWTSPASGYGFAIDAGPILDQIRIAGASALQTPRMVADPMLDPTRPIVTRPTRDFYERTRFGDRVLVLKFLYAFSRPERWDVVVFKNPTDPVGETQNYIKRLVGLPNEQLLLIDGDVWTAPLDAGLDAFRIERKPDYIQRAVWQPIFDSDFIPVDIPKLEGATKRSYEGPPWRGEGWDLDGRVYRRRGSEPSELRWLDQRRRIDDWNAYNMWRPVGIHYPVSDLRLVANIEAESPERLETEFELAARGHQYRWTIRDGRVILSIRHAESLDGPPLASVEAPFSLPAAGRACELEFWHVDQRMSFWLNGRRIAHLDDNRWTIADRIRYSFFGRTVEEFAHDPVGLKGPPPQLVWRFAGSPVNVHRIRIDRDLHYRPGTLNRGDQFETNGPPLDGLAFGSDLNAPARLGSDQYLLLGDNSAASRDGRVWGRPHPLVVQELGVDAPFVVPGALLLGKAWCVYFPAPLPVMMPNGSEGKSLVPDFGSLRFIR
jgi:signal peptidase I